MRRAPTNTVALHPGRNRLFSYFATTRRSVSGKVMAQHSFQLRNVGIDILLKVLANKDRRKFVMHKIFRSEHVDAADFL
jgi:hypothetical protein